MPDAITCRCGHSWQPKDEWDAEFCPECGRRIVVARARTDSVTAQKPGGALPPAARRPRDHFDDDRRYDRDERGPRPAAPGKWYTSPIFIILAVLGVTGLGFVSLVGLGFWSARRAAARRTAAWTMPPTAFAPVNYCEDVVRRRGVPEGVQYIDVVQARQNGFSARITRRQMRIVKVEYLDGRLQPIHHDAPHLHIFPHWPYFLPPQATSFSFDYDRAGNVSRERAFDAAGMRLWTLHYTSPTTAEYEDDNGQPTTPFWLGASKVSFVWSPEGWEAEVHLLDEN